MNMIRFWCRKILGVIMLLLAAVILNASATFAASQGATQSVTVNVPSTLTFTTTDPALAFDFTDYISGSETNVLPASYQVKANNLTATARVELGLSSLIADMDFKGDGQAYTKTSGNASFTRQGHGYLDIGTTPAVMYNQRTDGGSGKSTQGTFLVNYKFVAAADLDAGSYGPVTLTATVFDV